MKLTIAAVPVAASVLAPASALAECAWVLWARKFTDGGELYVKATYPSIAECDNALDTEAEVYRSLKMNLVGPADHQLNAVPRPTGSPINYRVGLICLPDSVDPRG